MTHRRIILLLQQLAIVYLLFVRVATTTDPLREKTLHALETLRVRRRRPRESRRILSCILLKPHSSFESCSTTSDVLLELDSKPPLNLGVKNGLFSPGVVSGGPTLDARRYDDLGTSSYSTTEQKNLASIHENDIPVKYFIDQVNKVPENERKVAIEDARKAFPRQDASSTTSSSRPRSQTRTRTTTTKKSTSTTTTSSSKSKNDAEQRNEAEKAEGKAETKLENQIDIPRRDWQVYDDYDENVGDSELMRFHRVQTKIASAQQEQHQSSDDDMIIKCKLNGGTACGYTSATSPSDTGPSLVDEVEAMKSDDDDEDDSLSSSSSALSSSSSSKESSSSSSSWKQELSKMRKSIAEQDEAEQETAAIHFLVNKLSGERNAACKSIFFFLVQHSSVNIRALVFIM